MRKYQVWLKGMTKFVEVRAEDMEVSNVEGPETAYWNFFIASAADRDHDITVAAFPFNHVEYIMSEDA